MINKDVRKASLFFIISFFLLVVFFIVKNSSLHQTIVSDTFLVSALIEIFTVALAIAIIMQGWVIYSHTNSRYQLYIPALFIVIGSLDVIHFLTYMDVPFQFVLNTAQTACWFLIISRLFLAFGIYTIFLPDNKSVSNLSRLKTFGLSTFFSIGIVVFIMFFSSSFPNVMLENGTATKLRIFIDYGIMILLCLSIATLLVKYVISKKAVYLTFITAVLMLFFSEVTYVAFLDIPDSQNIYGQAFKVLAYFFFLQTIYIRTLEEPLKKHQESQKELIQARERINYLAYHDELTGLNNRNYFLDYSKKTLMKNPHKNYSLMLINISRFKVVNDTFGNHTGDLFLKAISEQLSNIAFNNDWMLARIAGDEFAILVEDIVEEDRLIVITDSLIRQLSTPFKRNNLSLKIDFYIGIATSDGLDEKKLFDNASIALHEAKRLEKPYVFYSSDLDEGKLDTVLLEIDLRQSIERNELLLHYQPQIDISTGKIIGVEALIRWKHHSKGMISPGQFIPLAEESGLIVPIGEWVLREACRQLKEWNDKGHTDLRMAINLSLRQFYQDNLIEVIETILQEYELDPAYVELEITESIAMNIKQASALLKELKRLGVRIAIDDFGTGYSSFSYLHTLPIDQLKIDQSFIRNLSMDEHHNTIVETLISLGSVLKLETMAEGVETMEQFELLRNYHCDCFQGYLFSRPLPAEDVEALLTKPFLMT